MQTKHILTSDFLKTKKQTHSHKTKHILTLQHLIPLRQIHKTTEWELKVYGTDFHFQTFLLHLLPIGNPTFAELKHVGHCW